MTAPGSHNQTIGLMSVARDAFTDAFRALEQLQTLMVEDQSGIWAALHVTDDHADNVVQSVSAAFDASDHGPAIADLVALSEAMKESAAKVRQMLNLAIAEAENGKTSATHGVNLSDEILTHLAAVGNQ